MFIIFLTYLFFFIKFVFLKSTPSNKTNIGYEIMCKKVFEFLIDTINYYELILPIIIVTLLIVNLHI